MSQYLCWRQKLLLLNLHLTTDTVNVKLTLYGPFGTCFVSELEDEAVSVYPDDRKILDNTKIIKIIITKLLSLCLTTEIFYDRNKFTLYGPFGACFVSKMEDEAVSVYHKNRKILDNTKIIITKLLSLCLTTEIFEDRNC